MRDGAANTAGQAGSRREPRQTAGKTVSQAAPGCSLCLGNESRINLQDVGSHKSINKAVKSCQKTSWISSQPSRKKTTHTHTYTLAPRSGSVSRKDARVDLYGSSLRGTRSFSTTNNAHTTAPLPQSIVGEYRKVVRRCCSPDFTWQTKRRRKKRGELSRNYRLNAILHSLYSDTHIHK